MTEALFSINNAGKLISATYYTITPETLKKNLFSNNLIIEILRRVNDPDCKEWRFAFEGIQVEILQKYEHKIEFFVSRDISECESCHHLHLNN